MWLKINCVRRWEGEMERTSGWADSQVLAPSLFLVKPCAAPACENFAWVKHSDANKYYIYVVCVRAYVRGRGGGRKRRFSVGFL